MAGRSLVTAQPQLGHDVLQHDDVAALSRSLLFEYVENGEGCPS